MGMFSDCPGDCKESKYIVFIDSVDKIWTIEKLSLLLSEINLLGFTINQAKVVARDILESNKQFKLFKGEHKDAFKVLDILLKNKIEATVVKSANEIWK